MERIQMMGGKLTDTVYSDHHILYFKEKTYIYILAKKAMFCLWRELKIGFLLFLPLISEKAMETHSSTLAWKIPWTEEPGKLQSMGSLRVRHDWVTSFHFSLSCIGEGNGNPLQCSCLESPTDGRAWWAAVYGVTHSRTRLKRLSSSSYLQYF